MQLSTWFKRLRTWQNSETISTRPRRRVLLSLEALESRDVPSTLTVTSLADMLTPGTLRYELAAAGANDTINFSQNLAGGTISLGSLGELQVTNNVIIENSSCRPITIDAHQASRVFDVTAPNVAFVLSGVTITGGKTLGSGGGIDAEQNGDQVTIANCTIFSNSATAGGGVNVSLQANIANSTISRNSGGGITAGFATIENSCITRNDGTGVSVSFGKATIADSSVSANTGNGVTALYGVSVTNSTIFGNGVSGVNGGGVTLTNSTVSGNGANGFGGGIFGQDATISNSTISGNFGTGGVVAYNLTLTDSTVSRNTITGDGGGVNAMFATIANSTICGNSATGNGGGVNAGTTASISNSTISGNQAGQSGGGIAGTGATISNSSITGNRSATDGGGVDVFNTIITYSTVSGNEAQGDGGGVFGNNTNIANSTISRNTAHTNGGGIVASYTIITNSTIAENSAGSQGGGVFLSASGTNSFLNDTVAGNTGGGISIVNGSPVVSLINTIVANNLNATATAADDVLGSVTAVNCLIRSTTGTIFTNLSSGNILNQDPRLLPLGNYGGPTQTMALRNGSPAIDAGTPTGAPAIDQRGVSRTDGQVDIGAFESQGFTLRIVCGHDHDRKKDRDFGCANDPGVPDNESTVHPFCRAGWHGRHAQSLDDQEG